jgi:hypothetical protein
MGDRGKQIEFYQFLRERTRTGEPFTKKDLCEAIDWKITTVNAYFNKQIKEFLRETARGFTVDTRFKRLTLSDFLELVTQKRRIFPEYNRFRYTSVVIYEFLLPLTREHNLRDALDDLFFEDTILRRIEEIGLETLRKDVEAQESETSQEFKNRIVNEISKSFGGYSISHVNGRFRAGEMISREKASQRLIKDEKYLVDETTASVRFVVPIEESKSEHGESFEYNDFAWDDNANYRVQISRVRALFFHFFVEAVVQSFRGEDEIWLIERTDRDRLYKWVSKRPH